MYRSTVERAIAKFGQIGLPEVKYRWGEIEGDQIEGKSM